jgi:hypothetical protein
MSATIAKRALVLVGSPKPKASASRTLAEAVGARLEHRGWETRIARVTPAFSDAQKMGALVADIAESDLVVLAFPLYVDSLPAPVLGLLEAWRDALSDGSIQPASRTRLAVLTQCGFPEAKHCDVALTVCRLFAEEVGVEWAGALAFGMGGSVEGGSIERSPMARVLPELDRAVAALAEGRPIPETATSAFARPIVPAWTYPLFGYVMWTRMARKQGCSEPLTLRRYAQ